MLAAAFSSLAATPEPTTTASPMSEQPGIPQVQQPPSEHHEQRSATGDNQADRSPEPEPLPAPVTIEAEGHQEPAQGLGEAKRNQNAVRDIEPPSFWAAFFTGIKFTDALVAAAAPFAVYVAYLQVVILRGQARTMRRQTVISAKQTAILREQTAIARRLANMEGPVLFVHNVELAEPEPIGSVEPSDGTIRPTAHVHFANYGRTPAILLCVECDILLSKRPPPRPEYGFDTIRTMPFRVVEIGQKKGFCIKARGRPMSEEAFRLPGGLGSFFIYGRLIYRDPYGDRVETGFGYWLGGGSNFWPSTFDAYNYRQPYCPNDKDVPHA